MVIYECALDFGKKLRVPEYVSVIKNLQKSKYLELISFMYKFNVCDCSIRIRNKIRSACSYSSYLWCYSVKCNKICMVKYTLELWLRMVSDNNYRVSIKTTKFGILLPKLIYPTMRKKCSSDREKNRNMRLKAENLQNFWEH